MKHRSISGICGTALLVLSLGLFVLQAPASDCTKTSVGFLPLIDLGAGFYQGKQGGLYPKGSNTRPPAHETAGLSIARAIRPLNSKGQPDDTSGKIVFLSIGMSNTTMEFSTFKPMADADPDKNPKLVIVDGAVGGMTASVISNLSGSQGLQYWQTVDTRLAAASVTPAQVQVAWLKEANANPTDLFPTDALVLKGQLGAIARILKTRFPNIGIVYNSSRIYGGYASTTLNPEPFAYQTGFAVKWLIEDQINGSPDLNFDPEKGAVKAPWLSWGPYLWADGLRPRSDGLTYACSDLQASDGTHPAPGGAREKVAHLLLDFVKTDSTAKLWFLRPAKAGDTSLFYPALVTRQGNPYDSSGSAFTGLAIANLDTDQATLNFTAFDGGGNQIAGPDVTNPRSLTLPPGGQLPRMDYEIFGSGIGAEDCAGWCKVDSTTRALVGFFEIFNGSLDMLDGVDASARSMSAFVLPDLEVGGFMEVRVANPNAVSAAVKIELLQSNGTTRAPAASRTLDPYGALIEQFSDLFPSAQAESSDYLCVTASQGVIPFALFGKPGVYLKALNGQDMTAGATTLYSPQYAVGGGWRSALSIVNLDSEPGNVTLALFDRAGQPIGGTQTLDIEGQGKIQIDAQDFFITPDAGLKEGYVVITSNGVKLAGSVSFGDAGGNSFASALPLVADLQQQVILSHVASDSTWYTGIAMVNPNAGQVQSTIEVFDAGGMLIGHQDLVLEARQSKSQLLTQYIPALATSQLGSGYVKLTADRPIASYAVYGSRNGLSAVPPQILQ